MLEIRCGTAERSPELLALGADRAAAETSEAPVSMASWAIVGSS